MTVEKILGQFDAFKSNEIEDHVKVAWLCDVEGKILCDVYGLNADDLSLPKGGRDELTWPESYSRVYLLYMAAMTELLKGNMDAYSRIMSEYRSALSSFARYYIRNRKK